MNRIVDAVRWLLRPPCRGQALVEFALVIPIFLLLLFGIVDVGRMVYMNSTLSQAAREGARVASVEARWVGLEGTPGGAGCNNPAGGGPVCPTDLNDLRADVLAGVNRMMTPLADIPNANMHLSCDATTPPTGAWTSPPKSCSANTGAVVSVRVAMDYQPITPIIGQLLGSIQLAGSASMSNN